MQVAQLPIRPFQADLPASIQVSMDDGEITPALLALLRRADESFQRANLPDALDALISANEMGEDNPFTLRVIGAMLFRARAFHEALSIYLRLDEKHPAETDVLHSIAVILYELREFEPALDIVTALVSEYPQNAEFWATAGLITVETESRGHGEGFFHQALELDPQNVTALLNLGWLCREAGRLEQARDCYELAHALSPKSVGVEFNYGMVLLACGDYEQGWKRYEARTNPASHAFVFRDRPFQVWADGRLQGLDVLVGAEQGIGDQIHFAPYVDLVAEDAKSCVLEVNAKLAPIFRRSFPNIEVRPQEFTEHVGSLVAAYPWIDREQRRFDAMINLGSVPLYVRQTRGEWPARRGGYLKADPDKAAHWRERLAALGPGPKVGFIWASGLLMGRRAGAYYHLDLYESVFRTLRGATLVSLQYLNAAEGIEYVRERYGIEIVDFPEIDHLNDLDTVAALATGLDFVVGAKTAPLMLAAGLGVPSIPVHGGSAWIKPLDDGFDPYLPALHHATGPSWIEAMQLAEATCRDWLDRLSRGEAIGPRRTEGVR